MKEFLFLYPIPEIIDFEVENSAYGFVNKKKEEVAFHIIKNSNSDIEKESILNFRDFYKSQINACIDQRYRKNGFGINYLIFDDSEISELIILQKSDKIIKVGLDYKIHKEKQSNGDFIYPNQDYILNQFNNLEKIRISGFHMWDCVEKLAKVAYDRGLETLVDEDLTEYFPARLKDPDFKINKYPTYNPRKNQEYIFNFFMNARKEKPWLWQEY